MSGNISYKSDRYNQLIKDLVGFFNEDTYKLITFLRQKGYSDQEIAPVLGISAQRLGQRFPRGGQRV